MGLFMIACVTCLSVLSSCASQKDLQRNICDQDSGIPSRAVSSDLVFEGELVRRFRPSSNISFGVTFKVLKLLKGGSDLDNQLNLITSHKCVSTAIKSRTRYIVFIDHRTSADKIATGSRRIKYRLSVMPVIATKEVIKTVRQSVRSENLATTMATANGHLPETELVLTVGDRLELRCRSNDFSKFQWMRDGRLLRKDDQIRIKRHSKSSRLTISRVQLSDQGSYECRTNGSKTSQTRVRINQAPAKPHSIACDDHSYCMNRGLCYVVPTLDKRMCVCQPGFTGERCREKDPGFDASHRLDTEKNATYAENIATVAMVASVTSLAFFVIVLIVIVRKSKKIALCNLSNTTCSTFDNQNLRVGIEILAPDSPCTTVRQVAFSPRPSTSPIHLLVPGTDASSRRTRLQAVSTSLDDDECDDLGLGTSLVSNFSLENIVHGTAS